MTYTRSMLLGFLWVLPGYSALGQTPFPEKPVPFVAESSPSLLDADESRQRIATARSLLRDGKLWDAATLLTNQNAKVNLNSDLEPGLVHLTRALLEFHRGNLRAAESEARVANDFSVQGDALLLRSLIYAKACVWSISQQLLQEAKDWDPLRTAHDREPALIRHLEELLTAHAGPAVPPSLDDDAPWAWRPGKYDGFRYRINRQAAESDRSVIIVRQVGSTREFRAAFSLEPHDRPGQPATDPLRTAHDREPALIRHLEELLTAHAGPAVPPSLDDDAPWAWRPGKYDGFRYRINRQAAESDRSVIIVRQVGSTREFRAAFSLEPHDRPGQPATWSIFLCDLEAPPLRIADRLKSRPSDLEFLALAQSFDPEFGTETPHGRYTLLRAQLEALVAYEQGLAPLAMRWAEYAQTKLVQDQVIKPLQEQGLSTWTLRETSEFGPWQPYGHLMSAYVNDEVPGVDPNEVAPVQSLKGPLEHFHFIIGSRKPNLYCGSFVLASDEVEPGDRVYFLKRIVQGRAAVVQTYPTLPTFESVSTEVRKFLQDAPATPLLPSADVAVRIEDQLGPFDNKDIAFQKGFRKEYLVSLTRDADYFLDLTSPDFHASLRIEDDQGKDVHEIEFKLFMEYLDTLVGRMETRNGKYNPRAFFKAPRDGIYRIIATTFEKDKGGQFALTVQQQQRLR